MSDSALLRLDRPPGRWVESAGRTCEPGHQQFRTRRHDVAVTPEAVLRELEGLRALARSLVHGDAEVDDLLQDTAIAAIKHAPADDRPVGAWLRTVLRNRWRMDFRSAARRRTREQAVAADPHTASDPAAGIDRARALEKLAAALVALDEPFRTTVIRRYLDGRSAAELARELGV